MENLKNVSDQDLLDAFHNGSESAFEEIHYRYFDRLYVHALKMLRDEDAAQDVIQDVFVAFWSKRAELHIQKSLAAYLFTATRNRVLNAIEQERVYSHHIQSFTAGLQEFVTHDLVQPGEEEALFRMFEDGISHLPPKMKAVIELRMQDELSYRDIADRLSISDKTVKKQINNAIKILKLRILHCRSNLAVVSFFLFFQNFLLFIYYQSASFLS